MSILWTSDTWQPVLKRGPHKKRLECRRGHAINSKNTRFGKTTINGAVYPTRVCRVCKSMMSYRAKTVLAPLDITPEI